jgi:hypothetical protein
VRESYRIVRVSYRIIYHVKNNVAGTVNHPWGEGIQVCSNEGDCPSPRGDNSKKSNSTLIFFLKSSFPDPAGQIQSNLVQIILG